MGQAALPRRAANDCDAGTETAGAAVWGPRIQTEGTESLILSAAAAICTCCGSRLLCRCAAAGSHTSFMLATASSILVDTPSACSASCFTSSSSWVFLASSCAETVSMKLTTGPVSWDTHRGQDTSQSFRLCPLRSIAGFTNCSLSGFAFGVWPAR